MHELLIAFLHFLRSGIAEHPFFVMGAVTGFGAWTQAAANGALGWAGGAWSTSASVGFTLTGAQMAAAGETFLTLTGNGANAVTTPTAAQLLAQLTTALGFVPSVGFTWQFEISNQGNGTATLGAGTGVTINGTNTVLTTVNRTWLCTLNNNSASAAAVTLQNLGSRTN